MRLNEINFSFGGKHCLTDFGCIYVEKSGHVISPAATLNTYEISGLSGTIRMDGTVYQPITFTGNLFFAKDPPSQAEAQERLRAISRWLLSGRQWLVFDYEPDRYYLAEVTASGKWTYADWIEGGLSVEFTAQPFAFNVQASEATTTLTGDAADVPLVAVTGEAAPLIISVTNTGTAALTAFTASCGGKAIAMEGMNLAAGASMVISMEPPIGAEDGDGNSVMQYATQFDYMTVAEGKNTVTCNAAFDGAGTAAVTISARGRYI